MIDQKKRFPGEGAGGGWPARREYQHTLLKSRLAGTLVFLFLDDMAEVGIEILEFLGGGRALQVFAVAFDLAGNTAVAGVLADVAELDAGDAVVADAVGGGGGDGVLVGSEKEDLPVVFLRLVADHLADFLDVVIAGGVFITVGVDGDDDLARSVFFRRLSELLADVVDGAADGIEQGGATPGHVAGGVERAHFLQRCAVGMQEVFIVEEHEREVGFTGSFLLFLEEGVETGDGGFGERAHGARAIENISDFCKVFIHTPTLP